jgi:RHS repeat-associated protein
VKQANSAGTVYDLWSSALGEPVAEIVGDTGAIFQCYIYNAGGQMVALLSNNGGFYWAHQDHLGSARKLTDSSGAIIYRGEFDPHGQVVLEIPNGSYLNSHKFTGYEREWSTNLDYAKARMYNHNRARFMQPDPLGLRAAELTVPQSLNLYGYVGNDPINYVDPDGLFFKKLFGWIGKALKWIAIAVTVAIAILTVIPAAWAGVALGKMLVFLATHKTLAGIIGLGGTAGALGGRIGTPPTFPGTSSGGGVGGFLSRLQDSGKVKELGSRAWDWLLTDGLQHIANIPSGFADTITFGGTKKIRQWMGTDDEVDHDSMMYKAGEVGGIAWGFAVGGATGVKGVAKRTVSEYVDVTVKGARVRNIATNVPKAEFEATLLQNGFTKTVVGGGKVSEFTKGALRYTTRGFSKSGPPTAEVFVNGVRTMKIRLQ